MHGKKIEVDGPSRKKFKIDQLIRQDLDNIAMNLLKAIKRYKSIEPELEREFKHTGGWLKKKKLDELSGQIEFKRKKEESYVT